MKRSVFAATVATVFAVTAAQSASAQQGMPRGTTIENFVLQTPTGETASGRVRAVEAFNPMAGRGAATLVLEVSPGPLMQMLSRLHETKASADGTFRARYQLTQAWPRGTTAMQYKLERVFVKSYSLAGSGARATLSIAGVAADGAPRQAAMRSQPPERVAAPQRVAAPRRELDASRVPAPTRQGFSAYWTTKASQSPRDATALETKLDELERRSARGENVEREAQQLLAQNPDFATLARQLDGQPLHLSNAGGGGDPAAALICHGIGWIGKNGRLRCIGQLIQA